MGRHITWCGPLAGRGYLVADHLAIDHLIRLPVSRQNLAGMGRHMTWCGHFAGPCHLTPCIGVVLFAHLFNGLFHFLVIT